MLKILLMTTIGGVIGWITNILAIKMLFRPIKPVRIPVIGITIHGLIPKRRNEISRSIGEAVEAELINLSDILDELVTEENKKDVINLIKKRVSASVENRIPSLIPSSIRTKIIEYIGEQIEKEGSVILDKTIEDFTDKAVSSIKIGKMVENKIDMFELEKVEDIILKLSSSELKHIEVLGGVLGAVIGLVQGIIVHLLA